MRGERKSMKKRNVRMGLIVFLILLSGIYYGNLKHVQSVQGKEGVYTIIFDANGGKGRMKSQSVKVSQYTTLKKATFYKKGYIFQGWALSKKGKVKYKNKSKVIHLASTGKKVTLYAKWKKAGARKAIIIGETSSQAISKYTMLQVQETILHSKFYGEKVSKDSVYYYENRTKGQLKQYITDICKHNKVDDITYIYIVCHGSRNGNLYISTNEYFEPRELRTFLDDNVKGKIVLLIESCFSASFITKSDYNDNDFKGNFSENFINNFIDQTSNVTAQQMRSSSLDSSRYKVICSSDDDESSRGGKISLATKYWNYGAGWNSEDIKICKLKADKNKDNKITLNELYKYSYRKVKAEKSNQHVCVYPKKSSFIVFGRFNY